MFLYHSSPRLFHHLQSRKTGAIGTVRPNRKGMPPLQVRARGDIDYKSSATGMMALAWMDKKQVTLLSTLHQDASTVDVPSRRPGEVKVKPVVVVDYNKGKAGVDTSDQLAVSYPLRRKCVKWYQTLFSHLVDTAIVNAYLIHHCVGGKLSHLNFRKDLMKSLCGRDAPRPRTPRRPPPPAAPEDHALVRIDKYRRCRQCSRQGKRKVVRYECRLCNAGYCPGDCYNTWHAQQE